MADEKKKPEGWNLTTVETVIVGFFFLALLSSGLPMLWNYITSGQLSFYGIPLAGVYDFFRSYTWLFRFLGFAIAGAAAMGAFVLNRKADEVLREEKAKVYPEKMVMPASDELPPNPMRERWEGIVQHSESESSSDWRVAVIEADIILGELLETLQLPGETIGEKLKAVEQSDFTTIEAAWEAHKARNMIAHQGSSFAVNQREIRRIVSLYELVFKEFYLI